MIRTFTQGHLLPMMAPAAILRRVSGVNLNELSTSFFRFVGQLGEKDRPRCIVNALRQTMIVNHPVHVKVFYRDDAKSINDLSTFLMSEVISPELDTLMYPGYCLAVLASLRSTFSQFGMLTLDFGKGLLFFPEKAGISNLFSIREGSKGLQAYVYPYLGSNRVKSKRFTLARKADVPFASRGTLHGTGFQFPFDLTMVDHLDAANLGEAHPLIMCDTEARLREGEAIVSAFALETRIARVLGMFSHSAEEGFESQVNPNRNILHDLGMHDGERRAFLFQNREGVLLLKTGEQDPVPFIGRLAHFRQVVIEPMALFKSVTQLLFLLLGWIHAILKHFQHMLIVAQTQQDASGEPLHS